MITSPVILLGSNALLARDDIATGSTAAPDKQAFCDLTDFKTGEIDLKPYASFEPDFWVLDGNYKFAPATGAHVGLMSASLSDETGAFSASPTLTIVFLSDHSTNGITLHFSEYTGDYADDIDVAFYNSSNALIRTDGYSPSDTDFSTGQAVSDFRKIIITFNATNKAYRFLRLSGIDFDALTTFDSTNIKTARLVERIDPTALELPSNQLDFSVYSSSGDFSIVDPAGVFATIQNKDRIDAYEDRGNSRVYLGRFYLEEWSSQTENNATFRAIDEIEILDSVPYTNLPIGDIILSGEFSVSYLMASAATDIGFEIIIDDDLDDVPVYGWLQGNISAREYLNRLALVGGAYITCSRSNSVCAKMMEFGYGTTETKIDERDAAITWTGAWDNATNAAAYMTTIKLLPQSSTYPNDYFSFSFSGIGFILHYLYFPSGTDTYGKIYVVIDGGDPVEVLESGTPVGLEAREWESSALDNGAHTVVVYGWTTGDDTGDYAAIMPDAVTLLSVDATYDYAITGAEKGINSPVEMKPLVTGVEVTAHNYVYDGLGNVTVYSASLPVGTYHITFGEPHYNFVASGATITNSGSDFVDFTVATAGTVAITARGYKDSQTVYGVYNTSLPAGTRENIVKITDVPLIHPTNAQEIAQRIYNYYQQRYNQKTKLFAPVTVVGDRDFIDTQSGKHIIGIVEKMTTDLAGGMRSDVEIRGIVTS